MICACQRLSALGCPLQDDSEYEFDPEVDPEWCEDNEVSDEARAKVNTATHSYKSCNATSITNPSE